MTSLKTIQGLSMNLVKTLQTQANLLLFRKYPVSLVHFITERCNARCPHCFVDFEHTPKEMSLDQVDKLTRSVGPCLQNVNITGGEPFLHTDIAEIATRYLHNSSIKSMYITSNGSFPDKIEDFVDKVRPHGRNREIVLSFSLDHYPAEHDANRKIKGLFSNALQSYKAVKEAGPGFMANIGMCISQWNHEHALEIYCYLRDDCDVKSITFTLVRDAGVFSLEKDIHERVFQAYAALIETAKNDMAKGLIQGYDTSTLVGRLLNRKGKIAYEGIRKVVEEDRCVLPCRAGSVFGVIKSDGEVHPCEVLDRPIGKLEDYGYNLMELWNDTAARATREWIIDTKCHCTYECAWTINILCDLKSQLRMLPGVIK